MSDHLLVLTASQGVADHALVDAGLDPGLGRRQSANAIEFDWSVDRPIPTLHGIDANVVAAANRRKRLLIADMDSTMIPVECIDEIADQAGLKDKVSAITEVAMRGEMAFEDSLRARVALLEGLDEAALAHTYRSRIALNPGARALVSGMNRSGAMTALVSGGFTYFTERVAQEAGFQRHEANVLLFENGVLTGMVREPVLGREAKREALDRLCAELGIARGDAVTVGDGANDLAMIESAGLGVAYRAKPMLAAAADARLDHSDLSAVLVLQGIPDGKT